MITQLNLSNFRSLGENVDLTLGPLTALVGLNGSGKSNAVDALRFLSECLRDGLDTALSRRGGFMALSRRSRSPVSLLGELNVGLSVRVATARGTGHWGFVLAQAGFNVVHVLRETAFWQPADQPEVPHRFDVENGNWRVRPDSLSPALERSSLALPLIAGDSRFHDLATELKNLAIYQVFPNRLREPQKPNPARPMLEHGENWASILKGMDAATWKPDLVAALARIVGDIDDISVDQVGSFLTVLFRHGKVSGWFDASQESDGTLRCAGILTALLQSPPLTLLGIEEPELTIHPGAIPVLYDFFRQAARTSQVLLTTHSPELLDLLDVEEVRVVERKDGVTRIASLAEEQRDAVKRSLLTPGELMRSEGLRPEES
ncbi:AAA family ATPase [Archangium sp.]|uniref:AAA family ATPase n=1 Tax=Archangium sp. TaxID=1872627 RepID=UPI00286D408D|nr:AAA family ATPase [Archangium sp.]